jgi:hypothetical protein
VSVSILLLLHPTGKKGKAAVVHALFLKKSLRESVITETPIDIL